MNPADPRQPSRRPRLPAAALALAALVALAAPMSHGQPAGTGLTGLKIEDLEHAYLACEDEALAGLLGTGAIARCSVIYEDLKQRAFGGDFGKLRQWYDDTRRLRPEVGGHLVDNVPDSLSESRALG